MRRYLLDTHVWIWYVSGSRDLPRTLQNEIDNAAGLCWLSPISLWETRTLIRKGRLKTVLKPGQWVQQALEQYEIREAPLTFNVERALWDLELPHEDPADHFLAATARAYDLTLVTVDEHLRRAPGLSILTA